jgi:hypothetical protein
LRGEVVRLARHWRAHDWAPVPLARAGARSKVARSTGEGSALEVVPQVEAFPSRREDIDAGHTPPMNMNTP